MPQKLNFRATFPHLVSVDSIIARKFLCFNKLKVWSKIIFVTFFGKPISPHNIYASICNVSQGTVLSIEFHGFVSLREMPLAGRFRHRTLRFWDWWFRKCSVGQWGLLREKPKGKIPFATFNRLINSHVTFSILYKLRKTVRINTFFIETTPMNTEFTQLSDNGSNVNFSRRFRWKRNFLALGTTEVPLSQESDNGTSQKVGNNAQWNYIIAQHNACRSRRTCR